MRAPLVAIVVVTHDDADDLPACLDAVAGLDHPQLELWTVDCASEDDSVATARRHWPDGVAGGVLPLADNLGFAGGTNVALGATDAPWVLTLNADAVVAPGYISRLLARAEAHPERRIGAVTGRLVRPEPADAEPGTEPGPRRLDACGMYLTPTWRHFDRGSGEIDRGQHSEPALVFGATGAASLFSRAALADVTVDGGAFDRLFFTGREDAELCFRLRERGWEILYEPSAEAVHRRVSLPERRRELSAVLNIHSLKNRYLLRLYHQTLPNLIWTAPFALARDLAALVYVVAVERSSLAAYRWLWRHRAEIRRRRRLIQDRRTEPWWRLDRWFLRR